MGLFKRSKSKEEEIPKLPPLPEIPGMAPQELEYPPAGEEYYSQEETHPLPAFPDSSMGQQMNQNTIKEAVTEPRTYEYDEMMPNNVPSITKPMPPMAKPMPPLSAKAPKIKRALTSMGREDVKQGRFLGDRDYGEYGQGYAPMTEAEPMRPIGRVAIYPVAEHPVARKEPLFIQLDKFEHTIAAFDQIKLQISEIESLLRNVKETQAKEEENLYHWQNEIEQIRAKLEEIDREIFSQI